VKLYCIHGETKYLVGSPSDQEDLVRMVLKDSKRKFIPIKGKINFAFVAGSEFALNEGTKYLLKE
jgi:hypothetical protein